MRIIKGTSPIPIPRTANVPGDIKRLSRETQQSIKALRDREYTVQGAASKPGASFTPWTVTLSKEEETWKAKVALGHVQGINPASSADPVIVKHTPTIGGAPLDAEEPPLLTVAAGQTVAIKISSSNKDIISGVEIVSLETGSSALDSTHYQPAPTGVSGVYFLPLCEIEAVPDSDPVVLRTARRVQYASPIPWRPNLWEGENVGGGAGEVYDERSNSGDKYLFRTIKNVGESGKPILKPLPDPLAVSHIPLRGIKELATSAQIKVVAADDDNEILIRGNSYNASLTGVIGQLGVVDGLVTSVSLASGVGGWWGTIMISLKNIGASAQDLNLTFENGLLKTVTLNAANRPGTEGTPGTAAIAMEDTSA